MSSFIDLGAFDTPDNLWDAVEILINKSYLSEGDKFGFWWLDAGEDSYTVCELEFPEEQKEGH